MKTRLVTCALAACATIASGAIAAPTTPVVSPIDDAPGFGGFVVSARTAAGVYASWSAPSDWVSDGQPIDLRDSRGSLLGSFRLGNEQFRSGGGPSIMTSFVVTAGEADTTFSIGSALLSFDPIDTCGRLTGSLHIKDLSPNRGGAGVTYTGQLANGDSMGGYYNGYTTSGTLAASGLPFLSAGPGGEASDSFDSGCLDLGIVSDFSTLVSFKLSAFDQADGSLLWQLGKCCAIPLPSGAAMGLAGLGLVVSRRRRA